MPGSQRVRTPRQKLQFRNLCPKIERLQAAGCKKRERAAKRRTGGGASGACGRSRPEAVCGTGRERRGAGGAGRGGCSIGPAPFCLLSRIGPRATLHYCALRLIRYGNMAYGYGRVRCFDPLGRGGKPSSMQIYHRAVVFRVLASRLKDKIVVLVERADRYRIASGSVALFTPDF